MSDIEERLFEKNEEEDESANALKIELQKTAPWRLPATFDMDYREDGILHLSDEGLANDFPQKVSSTEYLDGLH